MYRRIRTVLILGALLILAAAFVRVRYLGGPRLLGGGEASSQVQIEDVMRAERGDIQVTVSATGLLDPARRLSQVFAAQGTVAEILVHEGDEVQAGTILARLDTRSLELSVHEAELSLELQRIAFDLLTGDPREVDLAAAQAAVNAAGAQVAAAAAPPDASAERVAALQLELSRNQLWQAQLQRDQAELTASLPISIPGLGGSGQAAQAETGVTRSEYDVAIAEQQVQQAQAAGPNQANIASARAALASAQARLEQLVNGPTETDLAIADAQLQAASLAVDLARYQLDQAILTAPFSGRVAAINLVAGEAPPSNQAAVVLLDTSTYTIDLAVDEIDIARVAAGQRVAIVFDALLDEPFSGQVTRVDRVGTDQGGVISYQVRVTLDPSSAPVRVGMSATATITVDEVTNVIRVRNRFIRLERRTGQAFLVVRQPDGTLSEIEVTLGRRNETYSEIVSGVNEGDEIVLLPQRSFLEGFGLAP